MKLTIFSCNCLIRNFCLAFLLLWAAFLGGCQSTCQECNGLDELPVSTRLVFTVMSKSTQSEQDPQSPIAEESKIRTLYIYAFDDKHTFPDFYEDPFVNHGQGADGKYRVEMNIHSTGQKRFYLIANPPQYIKEQLTSIITEGQLRSMIISLQRPIQRMNQLPQTADGALPITKTNSGFPLSNQLTAYVHQQSDQGGLYLTRLDDPTQTVLTFLPLFRALGKVSVYAYCEGNPSQQEVITVTGLDIFNYTCDGYFIPRWTLGGQMDLEQMSQREVKVGVQPVPLLKNHLTVTPDYVFGNQLPLTSFYVCQNSFGKATHGDSRPGMPDTEGNRTTKLVVSLSDGRRSEISLPYLRRNDHLSIHIGISQNVVKIEFKEWELSTVTPDWDDGLDPDKQLQPTLS